MAIPGDTVTYKMTVHNYTDKDVSDVTVSDELSADLNQIKNTTADGIATYQLIGHTVTWTDVKIPKNSSVDLTINAEVSKDPKTVADADGFVGYKNIAKITEIEGTTLKTPAVSNEVKTKLNEGITLTVNKNDEAWSEGANKTFVLHGNDGKNYEMTDVNLADGIYTIYEKTADGTTLNSGVSITIKDRSGSAKIDYYTLKLISGMGIDTINNASSTGVATGNKNEYIFFKGEKVDVAATPNVGFKDIAWEDADGNLDQTADKISNIVMDRKIELTASATLITQKVDVNVLLNTVKKADTDLINKKKVEDIKKTITLVSEDGKTVITSDNFDKVPFLRYKVLVDSVDTGIIVDTRQGTDQQIDIEYFTLHVKGDTGIESLIGSGDYLKGSVVAINAKEDADHTFVKWTGSVDETDTQANNKVTMNAEMTVTATSKEIIVPKTGVQVTVNLEKDNNPWKDANKDIKLVKDDGTEITDFTNVEPGNYKIFVDNIDTNKKIVITADDVTNQIDKEETIVYYTLILNAGAGISSAYETATNKNSKVYLENTVVTINADLKKDNEFINWTNKDGKEVYTAVKNTLTMNKPITLTANAKEIHKVTIDVNLDGGAYTGFDNNRVTLKDKTTGIILTDFTKVPNGSYIVQIDGKDSYQNVVVSGSDTTEQIDYYSVNVSGDMGVDSVVGKGIYLKGTEVQIDATLKDGYTFKNWNQDAQLDTPKQVVKVVNTLTYVAFTEKEKEPTYTITAIVKKDNNDWNDHGKKITIKDKDGTETSDLSNVKNGEYTVYVDGENINKTITVNGTDGSFILNYYTVTLDGKDGIDKVVGDGVYLEGTKVNISALVKKDYTFKGWEGTYTFKDNVNEFTVQGPVSLIANAEEQKTGGTIENPKDDSNNKKPDNKNPMTGDTTMSGLMLMLFLDSALIIGALYLKRKKEV